MPQNILATIDLGDETSSVRVLNAALAAAAQPGGKLKVVTVMPSFGMSIVGSFFPKDHGEKMLTEAQEKLHAFTGKHMDDPSGVQHIIARGNVYEEVLIWAGKLNADLIVVGAHRPNASDYLLGPNSSRIVRHAQCSVLVVRDL